MRNLAIQVSIDCVYRVYTQFIEKCAYAMYTLQTKERDSMEKHVERVYEVMGLHGIKTPPEVIESPDCNIVIEYPHRS